MGGIELGDILLVALSKATFIGWQSAEGIAQRAEGRGLRAEG